MDIKKFKRKALRNKDKLTAFLKRLDEVVPEGLQEIVAEEDEKVWAATDCTSCAHCCKTMTPTFTRKDVNRIALHLGMSVKEVVVKWLEKEEGTGDIINKNRPCQFLIEDKCSIYAVRPDDCSGFPHHDKKPFDAYNDVFIQNVYRCPATYTLISLLKKRIEKDYEWD